MSASQLRKDTETLVHKALVRLRGPILERAIQIESHIDLYIASIYAETLDKEDEIICLILANMNMSTKLKIFGYLITKYTQEFKQNNPEFYNDLCLIYSQRNKIAHHPGAFDERSLEIYANFFKLTIAKTKYEKQTTPDEEIFELLHLSENDINGLQDMMDSYISKLRILTGHDPAPSNPPD